MTRDPALVRGPGLQSKSVRDISTESFKEENMKKLVALIAVLAISGVASAALTINVAGPDRDPAKEGIQLNPSDVVHIVVIASDGQLADTMLFIGNSGPGVSSLEQPFNTVNPEAGVADITWAEDETGHPYNLANVFGFDQLYAADLAIPAIPIPQINGTVVGTIAIHCEGPGAVTIVAFGPDNGIEYSRVVIEQIPEPMTLGLLGLGGLFLRRRLA